MEDVSDADLQKDLEVRLLYCMSNVCGQADERRAQHKVPKYPPSVGPSEVSATDQNLSQRALTVTHLFIL